MRKDNFVLRLLKLYFYMCVFIGDVAMAMEAPVYNLGPIFPPMSSVECSCYITVHNELVDVFFFKIKS